MNSDQFQDFRRDCWHANRATGSHINVFQYRVQREEFRFRRNETGPCSLFRPNTWDLPALSQPLSETKERANSCLVNAADRDVGVVDGFASRHMPIPSSSHPGSGRFCPLNSQKHVTVPAPGSKFDASRSQKERTCDRIDLRRNLR